MKWFAVISLLSLSYSSLSQNHMDGLKEVETIPQAQEYANTFREVSVGWVNYEKDGLLFDNIDTSNLKASLGTYIDFFGRTTKFLQDSMFNMANIQVITMDLTKVDETSAEILQKQMLKMLENGERYWDVKKKYSHTSTKFDSRPEQVEVIHDMYNVKSVQLEKGTFHAYKKDGKELGIVVVEKVPHLVPAFYAISFINLR